MFTCCLRIEPVMLVNKTAVFSFFFYFISFISFKFKWIFMKVSTPQFFKCVRGHCLVQLITKWNTNCCAYKQTPNVITHLMDNIFNQTWAVWLVDNMASISIYRSTWYWSSSLFLFFCYSSILTYILANLRCSHQRHWLSVTHTSSHMTVSGASTSSPLMPANCRACWTTTQMTVWKLVCNFF